MTTDNQPITAKDISEFILGPRNLKWYEKLDEAIETFLVMSPGMWKNATGPIDWYAVCNNDGIIIAYFDDENDAFRFRLAEINRMLNE